MNYCMPTKHKWLLHGLLNNMTQKNCALFSHSTREVFSQKKQILVSSIF